MLRSRRWTVPESRTRAQLNGVAVADGRAYAVGNRGVLLSRTRVGWEPLFDDGVAGGSRGLLDIAATDDGRRLWLCGTRGALGYYDRETGNLRDRSTPYGLATTFRTLAVAGSAGDERVHVGDDQGRIARLAVDGRETNVRGVALPGPGAPITALRGADNMWFAGDTSGRVHQSDDGREWRTDTLSAAMVTALAIDADGLLATNRGGTVYTGVRSFDAPPDRLAPLPDGVRPTDAAGVGHTAVVVGSRGDILARGRDPGFQRVGIDGPAGLYAVTLAPDGTVFAVGADGLVVEGRPR
ncbi:hypothetical protein JCM30237_04100 [Halolamina litorea]|jgi:photosystem II stability/assembly factor-like uncharacterized protein|uniref:hypothetical protein n=1 Tax=Halolamina litorea TaxID=1515593 RepID=UPI00227173E6|nr:hypothetical protein [Halolamina litorea]